MFEEFGDIFLNIVTIANNISYKKIIVLMLI